MSPLRIIGIWRYHNDPDLSEMVDLEWDQYEAEELSDYLEFGTLIGVTMSGPAKCRLCDFVLPNDLMFTDGVYQWHQLLFHYVREHKVRLPGKVVSDMLDRLHALQESESDISWWRETARVV